LALEKALKGLVCKTTRDIAPRLHNLARLAGLAGVELSERSRDILAEMNAFNIEGRYPDVLAPPPNPTEAQRYAAGADEVLQWLLSLL